MSNLIKISEKDGILKADSRSIAESLGIKHKNLLDTVKKYHQLIESQFGVVAFETQPDAMGRKNSPTRVCYLTEDQAIFIATLSRNTDKVIAFKADLVTSFSKAKSLIQSGTVTPIKNGSLEMAKMMLAAIEEQGQEIFEIKQEVHELKARTITAPLDYFTIAGYASILKFPVDVKIAATLGKKAMAICKNLGYITGEMPDPRFGRVRTYPKDVLKTVFEEFRNNKAA